MNLDWPRFLTADWKHKTLVIYHQVKMILRSLYGKGVKLSSWMAGALQSLDATLIKHTWSS